MNRISPGEIEPRLFYRLLSGIIGPRPIALVSSSNLNGEINLAPFSFFNVMSVQPPVLVFSPLRRLRTNTKKDTLNNVHEHKEVVINILGYNHVEQVSITGNDYDSDVNEFVKSGLSMLASETVKPFRVKESPVQFECKVNEVVALGSEGGAGNLIICEVLKMHISKAVLDNDNNIDQVKLDLVARAGGSYYSRAKSGFFEIPKPLVNLGIGVDALPDDIRNSRILSGNDIGMLANVEALPKQNAVDDFVNIIRDKFSDIDKIDIDEKHKLAKSYLALGEVTNAWKVLLF